MNFIYYLKQVRHLYDWKKDKTKAILADLDSNI